MAAWFDKASSQGLDILAAPLSTFPINMGCWVYPVATGSTQCVMSWTSATNVTYGTIYQASANAWTIEKSGGGTTTVGTAVLNAWQYILLRIISATSIRCHTLSPAGTITHAQNTSVGTMTGFDTFSLGDFRLNSAGPTNFFSGGIGEVWYSNIDCYPTGAVDDNFLRRLAYFGPLSIPVIKQNLLEYRTLFSDPLRGNGDEDYFGGRKMQDWTNTAGVLAGPHPPLPPGYNKIRQIPLLLTV